MGIACASCLISSWRQAVICYKNVMNCPEGPLRTGGRRPLRLLGALSTSSAPLPSNGVSSGLGRTSHFLPPCHPQVTVQYRQDNGAVIPMRVHTIVISVQHNEDITLEDMRGALKEQVIRAVVPARYLDEDTIYHLQPSGRFVIGGPQVHPCLQMSPDFAYVPSTNLQEVVALCDSALSEM